MSLINKMLQELDRRHATQGPQPQGDTAPLDRGVLAVSARQPRIGSELFWWALAAVMAAMIAWVGWVMWQITPRSVVTDLALQSAQKRRAAGAGAPQGQAATPAEGAAPAAAGPAVPPLAAQAEAAAAGMLKLATEMSLPASSAPRDDAASEGARAAIDSKPATARPARGAEAPKPAAKPAPAQAQEARAQPRAIPQNGGRAASGSDARGAPAKADTAGIPAAKGGAAPGAAPAAKADLHAPAMPRRSDAGKIDKRPSASSRERADDEFRRAGPLINQGRVSEGMDGLRRALGHDSTHDAARHTLVSLLLEARRVDEAALLLQEGLAVSQSNTAFAMMLARIMVDRKDVAGALALLQRHAGAAEGHAEYRAFMAALLQRLGRHQDAIDEYHAALKIAPSTGAWWVGLAISLEAAGRPKEAGDAFRRARASGDLPPDLLVFVDQRLKQQR